jgi:hypothetical protein
MHVLPLAGGLFDQPASWIIRMEAVLRADAEQSGGAAQTNKAEAERRLREKVDGIQSQ